MKDDVNRDSKNRESGGKGRNAPSTFEDLEVYQLAREFRKSMYAVARRLPDIEKFGLAGQMRRAAVSLTNNIAEGHGRYHYPDQIRFNLQTRGSLEELIDDLNTCQDESYLPTDEVTLLKNDGWRLRQVIDGYIRYLREQGTSAKYSSVRETGDVAWSSAESDSRFTI